MSGVEAAGLVLGAFPLLISACEHYKQGFEPLLKWKRFRTEFIGFIDGIDTERLLFDQMLERFLISTDAVSDEELSCFLRDPNYEGWQRRELQEALEQRLGPSFSIYMSTIRTMNNLMLELQSLLLLKDGRVDWASDGASKWDYQMKRIHLSFSKKGGRTLASLESHNRKLRELLDSNEKLDTIKSSRKDTTWANIFECIRAHASSIHAAIMAGWGCRCAENHLTSLRLEQRKTGDWTSSFNIAFSIPKEADKATRIRRDVVLRLRKSQSQISSAKSSPIPTQQTLGFEQCMTTLRLNFESKSTPQVDILKPILSTSMSVSSNISPHLNSRDRFSKNMQQAPASGIENLLDKNQMKSWIPGYKMKVKKEVRLSTPVENEKSTSRPPPTPLPLPPAVPDTVDKLTIKEIKNLCSAIRCMNGDSECLGYLSDGQREHELCPTPPTSPPHEDSYISLESLLSGEGGLKKLTRRERYQLAGILASSLLQLQTTQWLADRFDKRNIFFYRAGPKILVEHPYIRHSFPLPNTIPSTAEQSVSRFAARNSLTNLGILLLELCYGQTIESQELRKYYLGSDGKPHEGTDYMTARDWAELVAEEEPEFEKIVKVCVFCMFEEKADWENKKFTQAVYTSVVEPLDNFIAKWATN